MSNPPFKPPLFQHRTFNCPLCHAFSQHTWLLAHTLLIGGAQKQLNHIHISNCSNCDKQSVWVDGRLAYPKVTSAPPVNPDLPEHIAVDYGEASLVLNDSPRGAAALLRLAIQKLVKHLGEKGDNLNDDIAELVKKGLPVRVQQALDVVRVIGNNAVHPGQIELTDDVDTATQLFKLVNIIADDRISQPKEIEALFGKLPEPQRKAIEKRDGK